MAYSLYYMLTSRCNLSCRYCFRDTSKKSLESELNLEEIKNAISKLYYDFNVRKLTISGGEPTFLKDNECKNFIELMKFLRQFKHNNPSDNLRIILITNVVLMNDEVVNYLKGVVDRVTITIDACDEQVLTKLGRNNGMYHSYLDRSFSRMKLLSDAGFEIKLHSVVSPVNYNSLIDLAKYIAKRNDINIVRWKFFQYMGFGNEKVDIEFNIDNEKYWNLKPLIERELKGSKINIGFKSVAKQEESLFDLLPDGTFEYFVKENGQMVRHHSKKLFYYNSWSELFEDCPIDVDVFKNLHTYDN